MSKIVSVSTDVIKAVPLFIAVDVVLFVLYLVSMLVTNVVASKLIAVNANFVEVDSFVSNAVVVSNAVLYVVLILVS